MVSKPYYLILFLILTAVIACSSPNQIEFEDAFELSAFLKSNIHKLPGQKVEFQILTQQGDSVPIWTAKIPMG